jgi:hypothetical protein
MKMRKKVHFNRMKIIRHGCLSARITQNLALSFFVRKLCDKEKEKDEAQRREMIKSLR